MMLTCPRCGVTAAPLVAPGSGPHHASARCATCGAFIQWLPKERTCMPCINKVLLCGTMGQYGATLRYTDSGTACASFQLCLTEQGSDGRPHAIYIPCECWGKRAEAASEIEAGALAIFEGRLAKRKKGDQWEMIVSGFDLQRITPQYQGDSREPVYAV